MRYNPLKYFIIPLLSTIGLQQYLILNIFIRYFRNDINIT